MIDASVNVEDAVRPWGSDPPEIPTAGRLVQGVFDLPRSATMTVTYQAQIHITASPDETITNTAGLTWTSVEGQSTGERDGEDGLLGSGALDDPTFKRQMPS